MQKYFGPNGARPSHLVGDNRAAHMAQPLEGDSSILGLLRILSNRRRAIVATVLVGMIPLVLVATLLPAAYTATAQINVISPSALVSPVDTRLVQMIVDTHVVSLKSREFLNKVLHTIERDEIGLDAATHSGALSLLEGILPARRPSFEQRLETFQKKLDVSQALSSSVVSVRFTSTSPRSAASAANLVASLYLSSTREAQEDVLRVELERLAGRIRALQHAQAISQDRLQSQMAASAGGANGESESAALDDAARADVQLLADLMRRQISVRRQLESIEPRLWIVSQAYPPVIPSSPNPVLLVIPGLVLLLIGSCYWAIVRDRLDQPIRTPSEAARALAVPCLGAIPRIGRFGVEARPEQLAVIPSSTFAESIRSIGISLDLESRHRPAEILVLSDADARGCSTPLALGLAKYAVSKGRRVLLIDADVREPRLSRYLKQYGEHDLVDVVSNGQDPSSAVRPSSVAGCHVIPVRRRVVNPLPYVVDKVRQALDHLRARYDLILIDAPPAAQLNDAEIGDRVHLVVPWGTPLHVAADALRRLCGHRKIPSGSLATVVAQVPDRKFRGNSWHREGLAFKEPWEADRAAAASWEGGRR